MDPILHMIADNPALMSAVKSALLAQCDLNVLFSKTDLPNAEVYEKGRAWQQAREIIEAGFKEITKCRSNKPEQERFNPGR